MSGEELVLVVVCIVPAYWLGTVITQALRHSHTTSPPPLTQPPGRRLMVGRNGQWTNDPAFTQPVRPSRPKHNPRPPQGGSGVKPARVIIEVHHKKDA